MSDKKIQVEARGSDIESAVQAGLLQLGLERKDVVVDVVDEGSRGLLGIGARDAIVELTVLRPEALPEPIREAVEPEPPVEVEEKPAPLPKMERPFRQEEVADREDVTEPEVEKRPSKPKEKPAPTPQPAAAVAEADEPPATVAPVVDAPVSEPEAVDEPHNEEERELVLQITRELLDKLHFDVTVESELSEPDDMSGKRVDVVKISGEELGNLIGPRGETLNALQYILRLMVGHKLHKRADFVLDVEGYRERREQALSKLAERMANKVAGRKRAMTLEPMPPHERRIIHMTLRNNKKVYTESIGEGRRRKVRIFPQR